jgi:hypothetical protein
MNPGRSWQFERVELDVILFHFIRLDRNSPRIRPIMRGANFAPIPVEALSIVRDTNLTSGAEAAQQVVDQPLLNEIPFGLNCGEQIRFVLEMLIFQFALYDCL